MADIQPVGMTTNALMELADRLVSEADCQHRNALTFKKGTLGRDDHLHTEGLLREAATQLRTAAAEGGEAVAYCDPTNPFNGEAFSWPGTARDPEHTTPLYLHPPTDSGAGRDGERYRWLRENLLWTKSYDGHVRWIVEIDMPEPGIAESSPPVAESLDSTIDAALRAREAGS